MPIAVAFSKKVKVVGFDLNAKKIELYKNGIDPVSYTHLAGEGKKSIFARFPR